MRDYPYASGALCAARAPRMAWITLALALALTACGGDGSGGGDPGVSPPPASGAPEKPASRAEAARFLTQATFGPTDAEVDHVMSIGHSAWIDEQFAKPASSNLALWDAKATANNATVTRPSTARPTRSGATRSAATTSCASASRIRCRRSS